MVDLTAPPPPSLGNLRQRSEIDLRNANGEALSTTSSASFAHPSPLGGNSLRPETPERPKTATGRKKEWVNPLDAHFSKDPAGKGPGFADHSPRSPLRQHLVEHHPEATGQLNMNWSFKNHTKMPMTTSHVDTAHGYPSPPHSLDSAEHSSSTIITPSSSGNRLNAPSGLHSAAYEHPSLPSPAPSATRSSEDRWDGPVIRNVSAHRDTPTFHSARRRSYTMELEDSQGPRKPQTEGFAGNFADFDFGETVTRPLTATPDTLKKPSVDVSVQSRECDGSSVDSSHTKDRGLPISKSQPIFGSKSEHEETLLMPGEQSTDKQQISTRPRENSQVQHGDDVPSPISVASVDRPIISARRQTSGPPPAAAGAFSKPRESQKFNDVAPLGFHTRLDSDSRSRAPPPLKAPLRLEERHELDSRNARSPFGPPLESPGSYKRPEAPPARPETAAPSLFSGSRIEGDFPVTKGLPRGRQPPRRPQRSDEVPNKDDAGGFTVDDWPEFDRSVPRRSAIPAPLSPLGKSSSEGRMPTSAKSEMAPRLPSPTFPSLEKSLTSASDDLARSFELGLEKSFTSAIFGELSFLDRSSSNEDAGTSSMRVDAKKAPPRPAPAMPPPSPGEDGRSERAVPEAAFGSDFI